MISSLTAIVLSSSLAYAQEEDWRIEKGRIGQYLCSSDKYEWGYAHKENDRNRVELARYGSEDSSDLCFLIPKELISATATENKITVEVGYKAETQSRYSYSDRYYSSGDPDYTPQATPTSWSVALYTHDSSVSLHSSSWEIKEHFVDWDRRLGKDRDNNPTTVEIAPHLEYQLCIPRAAENAMVTYIRLDKQKDFMGLTKIESDSLDPTTCFVIDPLLVLMDGIFTVNGNYPAKDAFTLPESFPPVVVFTKNGFVSLSQIPDDVRSQPNHYYSKTPPTNACKKGTDDRLSLHFEDRDAAHMQAYAVLGTKESPLKFLGIGSPQEASFSIPKAIAAGLGFTFYAIDTEGNKSKVLRLQDIPACQ